MYVERLLGKVCFIVQAGKEHSMRTQDPDLLETLAAAAGCDYPVSYTHLDVYKRQAAANQPSSTSKA